MVGRSKGGALMRLAADRPVKIVLLGAGGTGGYVIPHLYRIAFASNRPCRVIIADGDIVERKTLSAKISPN